MTLFHWFVAICLVLSDVHTFYSLPVDDNAISFLRNYGYLAPKSDNNGLAADDILHGDVLTDAIKAMQKYGHIKETGVIDKATRELMKKPRCGNPDFDVENGKRRRKRYVLGHTKWEKKDNKVTWSFTNEQFRRDGDEENRILNLIQEAMNIWQHNSVLTFERVHDKDADIRIDFFRGNHNDGYDFTGPGGTLAHAFYPNSNIGGDVHLDQDESWDFEDGKGKSTKFFDSFLHELGHSLGLGHSSNEDSIMWAYYQPDRDLTQIRNCRALYEDDIHGIAERYEPNPRFKNGRVCHDGSSPDKPTKVPTPRPREWPAYIPTIHTYKPDVHPNTRRPHIHPSTQRPDIHPVTHRPRPTHPTRPPWVDEKPDGCKTSFDAITVFRNELMIFKDKWIWRLMKNKHSGRYEPLQGTQPLEMKRMWNDLASYDHIDAAFEMKNGNFAFFIKRKVFIYSGRTLVGTSDLSHYGFDHKLKKVDAIFRWNHNNNTFVFSGKYYWRVDDDLKVDQRNDYPRQIGHTYWKGVQDIEVDTAISTAEGTYFLSGLVSYKFNEYSELELNKPVVSGSLWMDCEFNEDERRHIQADARVQTSDAPPTTTLAPSTTTTTTTKKKKNRKIGIIYAEPIDPSQMNITAIASDILKPK